MMRCRYCGSENVRVVANLLGIFATSEPSIELRCDNCTVVYCTHVTAEELEHLTSYKLPQGVA